jgi:hypothetical protein
MVVEQRIGRVDRIGQESERIVIVNMVVENSVEEKVLERLLRKIGVFEESIGELDPIIGEEIERLTAEALRGHLTDSELTRVVEERGDALKRRVVEARDMLSRVDGLLAADQALIDEINAVTGERQIPSEDDLILFLNDFLARRFVGSQIPREATKGVVSVNLRDGLGQALEREAVNLGQDVALFARKVMTGPISLTLSREAGYRHPRTELLHLRHPLVRFAVAEIGSGRERIGQAFALRLRSSKHLRDGDYVFGISIVELKGSRPTIKFAIALASLDGNGVITDPDETTPIMLEMLEHGQDTRAPDVASPRLQEIKARAIDAIEDLIRAWGEREQSLDFARRQQRHAVMRSMLEFRLQRSKERQMSLERRGAAGFPIRMAKARADRAQNELQSLLDSAPVAVWDGVEQEEVAAGFLCVGRSPS